MLIAGVVRGGPADRAGVKPGDILVEVDGKPVPDSSAMLNLVAAAQPGKAATLKIMRNGAPLTVKLTVGKRPKPRPRPRRRGIVSAARRADSLLPSDTRISASRSALGGAT